MMLYTSMDSSPLQWSNMATFVGLSFCTSLCGRGFCIQYLHEISFEGKRVWYFEPIHNALKNIGLSHTRHLWQKSWIFQDRTLYLCSLLIGQLIMWHTRDIACCYIFHNPAHVLSFRGTRIVLRLTGLRIQNIRLMSFKDAQIPIAPVF